MALNFKIYQSKREGTTNGKYYARALHTNTIDLDGLAIIMQNNCTLKRSDIKAVLTELVEVMTNQLQDSKRVKIDGFGTFKLGITTKPATTAASFTAAKNIVGTHVLFMPEVKIGVDKKRTYSLTNGVKLREADLYNIDKSDASGNSLDEGQNEGKEVTE